MSPARLWRLLLVSVFALLVVACKPYASFTVSPEPVTAGQVATFDATGSLVAPTPRNNAATAWQWDFGDGATSAGQVATHTYTAPGTYTVKLSVTDKAGRIGTATEKIVVQPASEPTTTSVQVNVQIAGGVNLAGAQVKVGTATAISDAQGVATLDAAPVGQDQVVTVTKAGYVAQSLRSAIAAGAQDQQLLVLLLPEKDTLNITDIAAAQTINSNYLSASVTLPANALVNAATGAPATGAATLKLTPWDITGIDLQAMPGNGRAVDATGAVVDLISAGMMTVDFFDAAGNKLQVAQGKTANIQMNLPVGTTGIGGNPIAAGTTIPLWHFDEARGLWVGEGVGTVVATSTGLAVTGTVSHFSTWNWDYVTATPSGGSGSAGSTVPPDATTLTLSCVDPGGVLKACSVTARITYTDGSVRSWSTSLSAAVTTIRNIPGNPTMEWSATTVDGLKGSATSGTTGNVVIQLVAPNVNNFVRCVAPDGNATSCKVTMAAPLADGSVNTMTSYIPAEGAYIRAELDTMGPLSWTASTAFTPSGVGTWTKYSGTATSGISGDVTITLVEEVVSTDKTVFVSCRPTGINFDGTPAPLATCEITIYVYDSDGSFLNTISVPTGLNGPVQVQLPGLSDNAYISVYAIGTPVQLGPFGFQGDFFATLGDLSNNQLIEVELSARPLDPN